MANRRTLPSSPLSIALARRYVAEVLGDCDLKTIESAALMVSELATNSVSHAHSPFTIDIDLGHDLVHVAVSDSGSGTPARRTPTLTEPTGRGLQIVAALAHSWGVSAPPSGAGKSVWFTLPVSAT